MPLLPRANKLLQKTIPRLIQSILSPPFKLQHPSELMSSDNEKEEQDKGNVISLIDDEDETPPKNDPNDIFVDRFVLLDKNSISRLQKKRFLNDEGIGLGLCGFKRLYIDPMVAPSINVVPAIAVDIMMHPNLNIDTSTRRLAKELISGEKLMNSTLTLMALNKNKHWTLLGFLNFDNSLVGIVPCVFHLNSLHSSTSENDEDELAETQDEELDSKGEKERRTVNDEVTLDAETKERICGYVAEQIDDYLSSLPSSTLVLYNADMMRDILDSVFELNVPTQSNHYDCGPFVIAYGVALMRHLNKIKLEGTRFIDSPLDGKAETQIECMVRILESDEFGSETPGVIDGTQVRKALQKMIKDIKKINEIDLGS